MSQLHYLTVQDVLWINLQVTKKVQHFNYARLEEATYYQYAYGESNSLLPQAARLITGFLKMHPLDAGNEATAFVALAAFLRINGRQLNLTDDQAIEWFRRIEGRQGNPLDSVTEAAVVDPHQHDVLQPNVRGAIKNVLAEYPCTVLELIGERSSKSTPG